MKNLENLVSEIIASGLKSETKVELIKLCLINNAPVENTTAHVPTRTHVAVQKPAQKTVTTVGSKPLFAKKPVTTVGSKVTTTTKSVKPVAKKSVKKSGGAIDTIANEILSYGKNKFHIWDLIESCAHVASEPTVRTQVTRLNKTRSEQFNIQKVAVNTYRNMK